MLNDLIAAKPEDASSVLAAQSAGSWPTLAAKTVDQVKLASFAFILRGETPDDDPVIEYMKKFEPLADAGSDGPWVDKVPNDLLELLVQVTEDRVESLASAWVCTEEAQRDGWNHAGTASFVRQLVSFAAIAKAHPGSMLLRVCL